MILNIKSFFCMFCVTLKGGHQVEEGSTTPPLELMPAIDESGFTTTPNTAVGGGGVVVADAAAAAVVAVAELKPPVNPPDVIILSLLTLCTLFLCFTT